MQKKHIVLRIVLVFLSIIIAAPPNIFGYEAVSTPSQDSFSKEELDQMLAPIALYPDSLLAQVLMAATYPLEIVEAARWVSQHPDLQDELLDEALLEKNWDVSVKSLAHFPEVLAMMDEKIEWTTRMGDAFLAQENDVMDTVQQLRAKAEAAGNLQSTREQKVVSDQNVIMIEPSDPEVIYVPVYDPFWVYGPWWYPAYPPYAFYYPGVAITSGFFGFAFGFAAGFGFGWCDWDWHHHHIRIDYDRIGHFHRFDHNRFHGWKRWEHNPGHRRGVAYWDRDTSHRFGQSPERSIQGRNEFRGHGDRGFRRQPTESFQRQGMAHNNFDSRQRGQNQQFGSQRNDERREFGARERIRHAPERSMQSRNEFRGHGDRGFRRQPTESFQRQGVARDNFGSRQSAQGQRFGSQRNSERREFGTRERFQPRDRTKSFSRFGNGKREGFASDRGQFSRGISGGGFQRSGVGSRTGGGGGSHGGTRGFGSSRSSGGGSHGGSSKGFSRSGGGSHGDARAFFGSGGRGR